MDARILGMKIYLSHFGNFDYMNELYKPIRESKLNGEYDFFLPHESGESVNTKDVIKNSDLILAEVSSPSTGQGIELGWGNLLNVPVVCISRKDSKISRSLKYIADTFITYENTADFIEQVSNSLKSL